jgi:hypothetical protein
MSTCIMIQNMLPIARDECLLFPRTLQVSPPLKEHMLLCSNDIMIKGYFLACTKGTNWLKSIRAAALS